MDRKGPRKPYFANGNVFDPDAEEALKEDWEKCRGIFQKINVPTVSFFGSAREKAGSVPYEFAKKLAYVFGRIRFAIVNGGGPGSMEAASAGAKEAGALVVAIQSKDLLDHGKEISPHHLHDHSYPAKHFSQRQDWLQNTSKYQVVFPGGYGTESEKGWNLVRGQTRLADEVPTFFIEEDDHRMWTWYREWVERSMLSSHKQKYISDDDIELLRYIFQIRRDNFDEVIVEIMDIVRNSPDDIVVATRDDVKKILSDYEG
jgi:predicted Rossmann-fold nucleotide-binding protein